MPEISYRFRAIGAEQVARGYDSITAAARRAKVAAGEYGRASGRSTPAGGQRYVREQERIAMQVAKAQEKAADRAAKAQEKAAARAAKAQEKSVQQQERTQRRLEQAQKRQADKAHAEQERAQRKQQQAWQRHMREQHRLATRGQRFNARKAEVRNNAIMGGIAGTVGGLGIYGLATGAAGAIADAAGSGFGLMRQAAGQREMLMSRARALSTSARGAGQTAVSAEDLLGDATRTARTVRGTKAEDVLAAQQQFVAMTGDLSGARRHSRAFAVAARATGARDQDIAATAATLREKFGIQDEGQMKSSLARMLFQGKSGAFEMSDASRYFTELGASGQRFGLDKGTEGVATLGGLAQLARMSTGSGAEASTATQAMLRQLVAKAVTGKDNIKSLTGADVFTDSTHTQTRDVKDVLTDVIGGSGGDLTKLQKIFGDEGIAGVSKMVSTFNEAARAADKNATASERRAIGEAAVRKLLDETINAGGDWGEVLQDAAANTDSYTEKVATAWDGLMADLGEAVEPAAAALAEVFTTLVGAGGPLIDEVSEMADGFASFVKFLQNKGLIDKPEDKGKNKSETPELDLAENEAKQKALEDKRKLLGGLSGKDKRQLGLLKTEALDLKEQVFAKTGGPPTATEKQDAKMGKNKLLFNAINGGGMDILGGDDALRDAAIKARKSADAMNTKGYDYSQMGGGGTGQGGSVASAFGSDFMGMLARGLMVGDTENSGGSGMSVDEIMGAMRELSAASKEQRAASASLKDAAAKLSASKPPGEPT